MKALHRRAPSYAVELDDWIAVTAVWGYSGEQSHGGVIADNIAVDESGNVVLMANGDWYEGDKEGVNSSYAQANGGKRTGAALTSKQTFSPGSFEVVMKIPSYNGICTSIWLYNYIASGDQSVLDGNYEIDIEMHGTAEGYDGNLSQVLCTNWITERDYESNYYNLGYWLNDGQFHAFRIDWHTGETPRVEYYVDGVLIATQYNCVPDNEMYFNIGCWFPENWCGSPEFETDYMVVKSFSYTPFAGETANRSNCGEKTGDGVDLTNALPAFNLLANGDFALPLGGNIGWSCNAEYTQENGITFDGELSQTATFDCAEKTYCLEIQAEGEGEVTVYYQSISGEADLGSESAEISDGAARLTFTPPAGCTRLTVVINGKLTVYSAVLGLD